MFAFSNADTSNWKIAIGFNYFSELKGHRIHNTLDSLFLIDSLKCLPIRIIFLFSQLRYASIRIEQCLESL